MDYVQDVVLAALGSTSEATGATFQVPVSALVQWLVMAQNAWKVDATGKLPLTAKQLQRRVLNDPVVPAVDDTGSPFLDDEGEPVTIIDPLRGHSVRSIRRNMRTLESHGLIKTGSRRFHSLIGGGHHRVYQVSIPDWLLPALFNRIDNARAAGGQKSKPRSHSDRAPTGPSRSADKAALDGRAVAAAVAMMVQGTQRLEADRKSYERPDETFVKDALANARSALATSRASSRAGP